ncbi:uncharacterized protein LOC111277569 [Durio zibethinus]|uniref:Uncharacterized protein LOC111277569 n=1 Tax=Durio zibethinus TaxID=66656 RepID=A0A6P5WVN4_DURZI|nr:uncharacterized protein LOC111277569 [Durio zibethinus]
MALTLALTLALPRYIVHRSIQNDYLGYIHEDGQAYGYLSFMETKAVSPFRRFQVEAASKDGLVYIRSCPNNKYWERTQNLSITWNSDEEYWITATANKPDEDQSKESCTLFKPICVDPGTNTIRIMQVQSGFYLCLWHTDPPFTRSVLSNYDSYDKNSCDLFTVIDWESLLILPRYVAFKGDNNLYLLLRSIDDHPYLQFKSDDIGVSLVACEILDTKEGKIRIKSISNGKFWRLSPDWIWADYNGTSANDNDILFRPVKVDNKKIGLLSLGNKNFCKRMTAEGKKDCLNAAVASLIAEAQLTVEEYVMTRTIYNVRYDLESSRIYDEKVILVANNSASNYTQQSTTLDVKLSYTETKTSTWETMSTLRLGVKATVNAPIPKIGKGRIELYGEIEKGLEWGESYTSTILVEVVNKVVVPAMTKVTVYLIATNGMRDPNPTMSKIIMHQITESNAKMFLNFHDVSLLIILRVEEQNNLDMLLNINLVST